MPVPEWGLRVVMVVRQRQRGLGRDAGAAQRREEALRIADAGRGGLPANAASGRVAPPRSGARRRVPATSGPGAAAPPERFRRAGHADIGHHRVHFAQPAGRFAQRPAGSRRPLPIPRSSCTTISRRAPAQVLQAVVRDDHVHVGMRAAAPGQPARAWDAPRPARAGARDQGGLVAECRRGQRRAMSDARLGADLRAVASADHARIEAARAVPRRWRSPWASCPCRLQTLPITTTGTGAR